MSKSPATIRIVAVMACALALAVVATAADPKGPAAPPPNRTQTTVQATPFVVIVRDAQTGLLRVATAQEIQVMAGQIDQLLGRGVTASKQVKLADGSTATVLTGNFANGTVARRNPDGTIEIGCFDTPEGANRFLGLLPGQPAPPPARQER